MIKGLVAGLVSAGAFVALVLVLQIDFLWSIGIALVLYVAMALILGQDRALERMPEVEGLTKMDALQVIQEGRAKIKRMRALVSKIPNVDTQQEIIGICDVAERIYDNFEVDPKDIKSARRFIEYYMDATLLVMQRYADLARRGGNSAQVQRALDGFEQLLGTIHHTFERQLDKLSRDDALDLDTEITVLKQMMEMEGL